MTKLLAGLLCLIFLTSFHKPKSAECDISLSQLTISNDTIKEPGIKNMLNNTKIIYTDKRTKMQGVKLKFVIPKNWLAKEAANEHTAYVFGEKDYSVIYSILVDYSYNNEATLSFDGINELKRMFNKKGTSKYKEILLGQTKGMEIESFSSEKSGIGELSLGSLNYAFVSKRKLVLISYSILRTPQNYSSSEFNEFKTLFRNLISKTEIINN